MGTVLGLVTALRGCSCDGAGLGLIGTAGG